MGEKRYLISETAIKTGLEPHVLRYWEEELGLEIPRNELGHRYYTDELIEKFIKIKELKEKGFQLKAVKTELSLNSNAVRTVVVNNENTANNKMEQFKTIIGDIVTESLRENNEILSDKVIKEMDYLLRLKEEAEEDRYKKLDETIRNCQRSNKEVAAGSDTAKKRKKRKTYI